MIGAIIFARMASTRLPSKVMIEVQGKPILQHIIERVRRSKRIQQIVLATTSSPADDKIEDIGRKLGVHVFRGSETDVLDRCYRAAAKFGFDPVVRITADDPFKDPSIIDAVVAKYMSERCDLACNTLMPTFPEGLDVEVISFSALKRAWYESNNPSDREHVTKYMFDNLNSFRILNVEHYEDFSDIRLTLDTEQDLKVVTAVYNALYSEYGNTFDWKQVVHYLKANPRILEINKNVKKSGRYQVRK